MSDFSHPLRLFGLGTFIWTLIVHSKQNVQNIFWPNFLCNLPITSNAILVLFFTFNKTNKNHQKLKIIKRKSIFQVGKRIKNEDDKIKTII